jgi:uncharacterized protein with ATP-grasp and redox domains
VIDKTYVICGTTWTHIINAQTNLKKEKDETYIIDQRKYKITQNLKESVMALSLNCMNRVKDTNGFQKKIKYFMQKAAIAVLGETDPIGDEHTSRVEFAKKVLDGTASVYEYTVGVVTNSTIASTIDAGNEPTDADLEFAVNSMFSDFSGWDQ